MRIVPEILTLFSPLALDGRFASSDTRQMSPILSRASLRKESAIRMTASSIGMQCGDRLHQSRKYRSAKSLA